MKKMLRLNAKASWKSADQLEALIEDLEDQFQTERHLSPSGSVLREEELGDRGEELELSEEETEVSEAEASEAEASEAEASEAEEVDEEAEEPQLPDQEEEEEEKIDYWKMAREEDERYSALFEDLRIAKDRVEWQEQVMKLLPHLYWRRYLSAQDIITQNAVLQYPAEGYNLVTLALNHEDPGLMVFVMHLPSVNLMINFRDTSGVLPIFQFSLRRRVIVYLTFFENVDLDQLIIYDSKGYDLIEEWLYVYGRTGYEHLKPRILEVLKRLLIHANRIFFQNHGWDLQTNENGYKVAEDLLARRYFTPDFLDRETRIKDQCKINDRQVIAQRRVGTLSSIDLFCTAAACGIEVFRLFFALCPPETRDFEGACFAVFREAVQQEDDDIAGFLLANVGMRDIIEPWLGTSIFTPYLNYLRGRRLFLKKSFFSEDYLSFTGEKFFWTREEACKVHAMMILLSDGFFR